VRYSAAGDTEAPAAPGGLSLVSKTSTQVQLQWNASSDNVGVDHYRVLRNGAEVGLPSSTAFTDTGLTANTAYQYAVSAVDAAGNESELSSTLNVTTNPATTPKVHISGISIQRLSAGKQRYARAVISLADGDGAPVGSANVSAQWSGLANDSENGSTSSAGSVQFDSNRVDRSATGQFIITVTGVSASGFVYDSAANVQTTACVDMNGTICSVGPPDTTPPAAPGLLTASPGPGSVSLNWPDNTTDSDWADFVVYRSTVSGSGYSAIASGLTASQYVDAGLAAGVPVYYVVTARDTSGNESGVSNQASATPSQPPAQSIRVSAITVSVSKQGKSYQGLATVTVRDQNNALIGNVQVNGVWDRNGAGIGTASATTSSGGAAALSSAKVKASPGDIFRFTVTNLSLAGYTYNPGANTETSDSAVAP
jgi:fibronectin type 3 domain-containing protein